MNYIEQMMKTAGIVSCDKNCPNYKFNTACYSDDKGNIPWPIKYPDFTAEKQLEIIKLIVQNGTLNTLQMEYFIKEKDYKLSTYRKESNYNKDFTQALAQLTTELMNAGELDKEKVKEVLEG